MKYLKKFQTNADYQAFKNSSDWITPNISVIKENVSGNGSNIIFEKFVNTPSLITFTVDGVQYQAEEGMIWGEWVNSEYNIAGFYIDYMPWNDSYVIAIGYNMGYGTIIDGNKPILLISDLILSGYEYAIYYENGGLDPI